jgi:hypothetical protein
MKRYALWALVILAAWWVIQDPASAAQFARGIGGFLTHAAHSFSTFASGGSAAPDATITVRTGGRTQP